MKSRVLSMFILLVLFLGFFMMHRMESVMAHSEDCPFMQEMKICTMAVTEHMNLPTGNLPDITRIFFIALFALFFGKIIFDDIGRWKNRYIIFRPAFAFLTKIYPRLYA